MKQWLDPDRWGMGLSLLCALHCLAAPVLFALVPSLVLALHSFRDPVRPLAIALLRLEAWHAPVVLATVAFATVTLALGWRRHRRLLPLAWLAAAAIAFAVGMALLTVSGWLHSLVLAAGGLLTVLAHVLNLRAGRTRPV